MTAAAMSYRSGAARNLPNNWGDRVSVQRALLCGRSRGFWPQMQPERLRGHAAQETPDALLNIGQAPGAQLRLSSWIIGPLRPCGLTSERRLAAPSPSRSPANCASPPFGGGARPTSASRHRRLRGIRIATARRCRSQQWANPKVPRTIGEQSPENEND